ncbi:uncharacterized protein VTP21DRAFT_1087 [Calcarisporiella thermophila]|uniref:uncharacterized protein n=1 Tax=Calcarisporiella thermophila TaxID=911321 RepID=UPI003743D092
MPRARIEGLLSSFPKLTSTGQQHTTVETEHIRYVYQPLEELFLVLITNRQSNILQDIDSLHLFGRVITDMCRTTDELEILRNAFEIISSFDEIVSLGYRENVNIAQVKTITEMESHEEKIQEIIARNKEQEAKEELKRRMRQLEMQRREAQKRGAPYMGGGSSFGGAGFGQPSRSISPFVEQSYQQNYESERSTFNSSPAPATASKAKGMQLGRKNKTSDLLEAMKSEVGAIEEATANLSLSPSAAAAGTAGSPSPAIPTENIHVSLEEKISMIANRDGGLESMEVKGDLVLKIVDPESARIKLVISTSDDSDVQFKTHPNVDRRAFTDERVIRLRDVNRSFPVNQSLPVLRWRFITKDETMVPLSINCWPSSSGDGTCNVNIEYELEADHMELTDVIISIPIPPGVSPTVSNVDGNYEVNRQQRTLEWQLPIIDASNKSGSLEFTVPGDDIGVFFPVTVNFVSEKTFCNIDVLDVESVDSNSSAQYSKEVVLRADEYCVV